MPKPAPCVGEQYIDRPACLRDRRTKLADAFLSRKVGYQGDDLASFRTELLGNIVHICFIRSDDQLEPVGNCELGEFEADAA